jgi:hypothetical protein
MRRKYWEADLLASRIVSRLAQALSSDEKDDQENSESPQPKATAKPKYRQVSMNSMLAIMGVDDL